METQSGSIPSHPIGGDKPVVVPVGTSKTTTGHPSSKTSATKIQPIFARDLIGYLYLCCKKVKEQTETRSFGSVTNPYAGLSRARDEMIGKTLSGKDAIDGTILKEVLAAASVSADTWNAVVREIGNRQDGRKILDEANYKGEALAVGLPEDASKQLRDVEGRLRDEGFVDYEIARLAQRAYQCQQRAKQIDAKKDISLYQMKKGSGYTFPSDGFEKYTAAPGWLIGSAFIKLQGLLASLFKDTSTAEQDPVVQAARNRTWLKPDGLSVKSPTIQALVKEMATYSVQTKIEPISNNKGYILEFSFSMKAGRLPLLVEKLKA
jgi:hypothetical protein